MWAWKYMCVKGECMYVKEPEWIMSCTAPHIEKRVFIYTVFQCHLDEKHLDFPFLTVQGNTLKFGCEGGSSIADKSAGKPTSGWLRESTGTEEQAAGLTLFWADQSEKLGWVDSVNGGSGVSSSSTLAFLK